MTMRCECTGCGEDCSHAYGTHNGYPYHFGCLPVTPKRRDPRLSDERFGLRRECSARNED